MRCWKWGREDGRQYYRGLIIQPSEMKRETRRTETNNGITDFCSGLFSIFFFFFKIFSLFYHLKTSFSKTHYLPFNQLPITKSKGFADEEGNSKLKSFVLFMCEGIEKNNLNDSEEEKEQSRDNEFYLFVACCFYRKWAAHQI